MNNNNVLPIYKIYIDFVNSMTSKISFTTQTLNKTLLYNIN